MSALAILCKLASPLLIPKKIAAMPRDKSHERSLENGHFGNRRKRSHTTKPYNMNSQVMRPLGS